VLVERAVTAASAERADLVEDMPGAPPLSADKLRCEAAMLLRAAAPVADGDRELEAALTRLAAELASPTPADLAVRACLHPGVALDLALVAVHLRAMGWGDERLEPLLADLFGTDRLRGPERPAHRELEQVWLLGLWSGDVDSTALTRALGASSLAWELDHLAGTTDDAYAFTHAILYATDHGRREVTLPRPIEDVVGDAEAMLAVALDAGNHDIAAEVLWTWPLLGIPQTPLATQARALLADVCSTCGFLPGPQFDPSVHERLPAGTRDAYVLRTSYHTTLVHGLLLAATLDPDAAPPTPAPDQATWIAGGHVDALLAFVSPRPSAADWWSRVGSAPPATRLALAPAFVTMALRRAADDADLSAVQQILRIADHAGIAETPPMRQGRLLLRRAMACTGLVGAATAG
jgi:hypothetical protein